ncbi:aldehyde dehydrogenase family protein [Petroclostridium sp. X23]|uniref:aldehyde dehydrogenase family protein n=1 Tax=Petroclostridium sp. X23 TaxID=3045146 RepID=UPI0024ACCF62|nr:aldehyde dehydrogenase family protein [Petroclostridium sp. X23]WHH59265.1 aldehyde dehydrogenase family protein [Petroclostridium sp. X23]
MVKVKTYLNYINGEFVKSSSGKTISCINPANQEVVGYVQQSNENDIENAIQVADTAFHNTNWRYNSALRCSTLMQYANLVENKKEELAQLLTMNNGKTIGEAHAEINGCIDGIRYYAGLSRNVFGKSVVPSEDSLGVLVREPVGVVGIISPWNWPAWLMIRGMLPALAAGNAIVVKPATLTAAISMELIEILSEVKDIPKGIINVVTGPGRSVGDAMVRSKHVDIINFTGDESTGVAISEAAAKTIKKLSLELGGKSPNVVFEDADLSKAVPGAIWAFLFTSGQLCMAGTRLVVQDTIYDEFLRTLKEEIEKLKVGNGLDASNHIGPVVSQTQLDTVMEYINIGKKEGKVITGGYRLTGKEFDNGFFVAPTVIAELDDNSRLVQEEIFGPVLVVQKFHTEEEAIKIANGTKFGLAGAVWTKDVNRAVRVAREIKAGTVWVNTYNKFYTEAEFGGYKASGIGRTHGEEALLECTEIKHINFDIKPTYF